MNVIKFKNNDELTDYVINEYFKAKKVRNIIIPSGSTPRNLYNKISKELEHSNINYYALDEWFGISRETVGSCYQMIDEDFASKIIGDYNLYTFDGENTYKNECERLKNITSDVQMDLAILGVGLNGHIGLNERTNMTNDPIIVTELDSITRKIANKKYFTKSTQIENGITFSLNYLIKAKDVLVILNSENKKDIWKVIQESKDENIPAVYLKQFENVRFLITDDVES